MDIHEQNHDEKERILQHQQTTEEVKSKSLNATDAKLNARCCSFTNLKLLPDDTNINETQFLLHLEPNHHTFPGVLVRSKSCSFDFESFASGDESDVLSHQLSRSQSIDISRRGAESATFVSLAIANPDIAQSFLELAASQEHRSSEVIGPEQKGCSGGVPNWMKNFVVYMIVFAFFIFALSRIEYPR